MLVANPIEKPEKTRTYVIFPQCRSFLCVFPLHRTLRWNKKLPDRPQELANVADVILKEPKPAPPKEEKPKEEDAGLPSASVHSQAMSFENTCLPVGGPAAFIPIRNAFLKSGLKKSVTGAQLTGILMPIFGYIADYNFNCSFPNARNGFRSELTG